MRWKMSVSLHQLNQIDVVKRLHHLLLIQYILGKNEKIEFSKC